MYISLSFDRYILKLSNDCNATTTTKNRLKPLFEANTVLLMSSDFGNSFANFSITLTTSRKLIVKNNVLSISKTNQFSIYKVK